MSAATCCRLLDCLTISPCSDDPSPADADVLCRSDDDEVVATLSSHERSTSRGWDDDEEGWDGDASGKGII